MSSISFYVCVWTQYFTAQITYTGKFKFCFRLAHTKPELQNCRKKIWVMVKSELSESIFRILCMKYYETRLLHAKRSESEKFGEQPNPEIILMTLLNSKLDWHSAHFVTRELYLQHLCTILYLGLVRCFQMGQRWRDVMILEGVVYCLL